MKKTFFFAALAAVALASCSSDETVATNDAAQDANVIGFRALNDGVTRAAAKSSFATNDVIDVYATYDGTTKYFQADFTKQADANFTSVAKYYWPSNIGTTYASYTEYNTAYGTSLTEEQFTALDAEAKKRTMTFNAFYGAAQSSSTPGSLAAAYTPDALASNQTDILYAKHSTTSKEPSGVLLNFRHMLSQINVQAQNTNNAISVDISGVRIGYVKSSGTFAYTDAATDTKNSGKLAQSTWTPTDFVAPESGHTYADDYKYDQTVTKTLNGTTAAGELTSYVPWMLIPQDMTGSTTQYQNAKADGTAADAPDLGGAYIALKMTIYNWNGSARGAVIIPEQWCYWPISTNWNPGYNYIYTVNVANGGYMPTDTNGDKNLDSVLGSPIEISVSCTVDDWTDSAVSVPNS